MQVQLKLRVYPLWREDVFKDIARIPEANRGGIREGRICTVTANGHSKQLVVRGLEENLAGGIMLDEITRKTMGMTEGVYYDFKITESSLWGQVRWACTVADSGARISAWIGIVSVGLGLLGLLLGVLSVWIAENPPTPPH